MHCIETPAWGLVCMPCRQAIGQALVVSGADTTQTVTSNWSSVLTIHLGWIVWLETLVLNVKLQAGSWINWVSEIGLLNRHAVLIQSNLLWAYMGVCSLLGFKDQTTSVASRVYLNFRANGFCYWHYSLIDRFSLPRPKMKSTSTTSEEFPKPGTSQALLGRIRA